MRMTMGVVDFLALLLFLLTETRIKVPASHWTAVALEIPKNSTTLHLSYKVENGASGIQAIVLSRAEAERFNRGRSIRPIFMSGFGKSGQHRVLVPDAGNYVLLLDNRLEGRFPTEVSLEFDLSNATDVRVRTVPPERRRATVALSLLFFGAVVVFTAVKFLRN
jgi:hypothetical protein